MSTSTVCVPVEGAECGLKVDGGLYIEGSPSLTAESENK